MQMRYRIVALCYLTLAFAAASYSQALPAAETPSTKWFILSDFGSDPGYKFPSIDISATFERKLTKRIEIQGGISFSPTSTLLTNDGRSLSIYGKGIYWVNKRFGVTAYVSRGYLWTSQFKVSGWYPEFGFVIGEHLFGAPGRFSFSYLVPTGCQWGAGCPLQSSRATGPVIAWDRRITPNWRFGFETGVYRLLEQGNPLDRRAGRTGLITGDAHIISTFQIKGKRDSDLY